MRIGKTVLAALVVLGAGAGGFYLTGQMLTASGQAGLPAPTPEGPLHVDTVPLAMAGFSDRVRAVGTTRAIRAVSLTPRVTGRVAEVVFVPGSAVEEGALLLQLDDRAEQAEMKAAEATLAEAQSAFDRQQRLNVSGSASDAAFQAARAALLRAEAMRDLARTALEDRRVTAPFAGVTGLTDLVQGQLVDPSTLVTTLDDLSVIEVAFRVPETLRPRLSHGQRVELTTAAWPGRVFQAHLSGIDSRVDAVTRSIALRAQLPNDDKALAGGMFMQAELVLAERRRPAIPERALAIRGALEHVLLAEDGTARQVEIVTGQIRDGMVEITSGLEAQDAGRAQVIVSNLQRLRPGMAIRATPLAAIPPEAPAPAPPDADPPPGPGIGAGTAAMP